MVDKNKKYLYPVLCVLALAVSLFPVACNYIMTGGIIGEWIARVEELAAGLGAGKMYFFPSGDVIVNTAANGNAMNSNLWFFFSAVLYKLTGNIVLAYRISMIFLQAGTLLGAVLFFQRIFAKEEDKFAACFGILLYMTCPFRIYVCYEQANMCRAIVWMLLPFYGWAVAGLLQGGKRTKNLLLAGLILAALGYADAVMFVVVAGLTVVCGVLEKKWWSLLSTALSTALFAPGLLRLAQHLFLDYFADWNLYAGVIMDRGYRFGELFTVYAWKDGHPGMGLGLMICMIAGLWLWFVRGKKEECKIFKGITVAALIFMGMSLRYFPWDYLQRAGGFMQKFVALMETPGIFAEMAFGAFCIPAASIVNRIRKEENQLLAYAVPLIILVACIAICIFQCNTLTYTKVPMIF
ncbi:MAG: hypothetical protein IJ282_02295 [Lachnospiraceae bacterium]|nr:hypothetical protein [Lachnospiraceae bacterium]